MIEYLKFIGRRILRVHSSTLPMMALFGIGGCWLIPLGFVAGYVYLGVAICQLLLVWTFCHFAWRNDRIAQRKSA